MDIQSVIVSFNELNNTKNAIANAIREKGVSSSGRFSNFASEIKSIQAGLSGKQYQNLLNSLGTNNIFRKGSNNDIEGVGKIDETFEVVSDNNVVIYSLYDITNVTIADGPYKSRITQQSTHVTRPIDVDYHNRGHINYQRLTLSITPIEADNPNGSVNITYTVNGTEHTVTMPIKDIQKTVTPSNPSEIYWLTQLAFNINSNGKDLKQMDSVNGATYTEPKFVADLAGGSRIIENTTMPAAFNTLNAATSGIGVNAMMMFSEDSRNWEYIPVKLTQSISPKTVQLEDGHYAGVLAIDGNKLIFYISDKAGRLLNKFIVARKDYAVRTDEDIMNKAKVVLSKGYGMFGIAVKADGSVVTKAEIEAAGFR